MTRKPPSFIPISTPNCDDEPDFDRILLNAAVKFSRVYRLMQMRYGTAQYPDHLHDEAITKILSGKANLNEKDED